MGTSILHEIAGQTPQTVAENIPLEKAEAFKKRFEDAGCTVELKIIKNR